MHVSKRNRTLLAISTLAAVGLATVGCSTGDEPEHPATIQVIATHSILADLTNQIVGDEINVLSFTPAGIDPHAFAPSTREIAMLHEADLIIENGLGLEEGVAAHVRAAAESGVPILTLGEVVDPLLVEELYGEETAGGDHDHDHDHDHDDHDHDHGPYDPHFWHDVDRVRLAVQAIGGALVGIHGVDPEQVEVRVAEYLQDLEALSEELDVLYRSVPESRRVLVSQHRVLGYLAHAYGYRQLGSILPGTSTLAQASAADLSTLVAALDRADIPAIFTDATQSDALARTVSEESTRDISIIPLYTESLTASGEATTYIDLMRTNAQRIVDGLTSD